jgi:hypothetical protein
MKLPFYRDHKGGKQLRYHAFWRKASQLCLGLVVVIAQVVSVDSVLSADVSGDHLIPPEQQLDANYAALVSQKLSATPANYARIVVMPSSAEGETAIAIYSSAKAIDNQAFLTCTKADRNIWYSVSESNPNRDKEPPVQITRTDASLPRSAAVAVSKAVNEMVNQTRPLDREDRIVLDGTAVEFSVEKDAKVAAGLLTPYAQGELTDALRRLVKVLADYCEALPAKRQQMGTQIERAATQLLDAIRTGKPNTR